MSLLLEISLLEVIELGTSSSNSIALSTNPWASPILCNYRCYQTKICKNLFLFMFFQNRLNFENRKAIGSS